MSESLPVLAKYFIHKGRAAARFEADDTGAGGHCSDCERRLLSYPDTCSEGWDRIREGRPELCKNWTGRRSAEDG